MTAEPPAEVVIEDSEAAARGEIYGLLARLFEEPDAETHDALRSGAIDEHLSELVARSGLEGLQVPSLGTDDDRDLLGARFNDLFEVGYPEPPVPLYESAYVDEGQWDRINVDLARAYEYFGVSIDQSNREHHDHLVLQLEFAGYLARLAAVEAREDPRMARRDFLDRHLVAFTADMEAAIENEVETGIYDDLVAFLAAFVRADQESLDAETDETAIEEVARP